MVNKIKVKFPTGNTAAVNTYVGPAGTIIVNIDTNLLHLQDGVTPGGQVIATVITETENKIQNLGNISGIVSINLNSGRFITATLTGSVTLSFTGLPTADRVAAFSLQFTGVQNITYPAGTKFAGNSPPIILGPVYELPCVIDSVGNLTVYGVVDNIGWG